VHQVTLIANRICSIIEQLLAQLTGSITVSRYIGRTSPSASSTTQPTAGSGRVLPSPSAARSSALRSVLYILCEAALLLQAIIRLLWLRQAVSRLASTLCSWKRACTVAERNALRSSNSSLLQSADIYTVQAAQFQLSLRPVHVAT
jgi:hypothetical protein